MHQVCLVYQIMKLAVSFIGLHFIVRLQIKPPQITDHDMFPEICSENCDPFRVIHSKYFSLMNTYVLFF